MIPLCLWVTTCCKSLCLKTLWLWSWRISVRIAPPIIVNSWNMSKIGLFRWTWRALLCKIPIQQVKRTPLSPSLFGLTDASLFSLIPLQCRPNPRFPSSSLEFYQGVYHQVYWPSCGYWWISHCHLVSRDKKKVMGRIRLTGGSSRRLPNQLSAVLDLLNQVSAGIDRTQLTEGNKIRVDEIGKRADAQQRFLAREVEKLRERFQNQDKTEWSRSLPLSFRIAYLIILTCHTTLVMMTYLGIKKILLGSSISKSHDFDGWRRLKCNLDPAFPPSSWKSFIPDGYHKFCYRW